jgi:ketosteroid isomerase-like protein
MKGPHMDVADFWIRSWASDDREAVRKLLAPDVEVEWNLDAPVDEEELVRILHKVAVFADAVMVVAQSPADDGAAVVYDLKAPFGTARMIEFLTVAEGRITEVRQVYDVTATDRYFPGLSE